MSTLAAILGIIEMLIYVFGLSLVFGGDQSFIAMFVYALGFGIGIILGTKIEKKLAIGYINVIVNTQNKNTELINMLRNNGFGVTTYIGEGRDSHRIRMEILTKRNRENELLATIEKFEPKAFIISYEPRQFKGGLLLARLKKHNKN